MAYNPNEIPWLADECDVLGYPLFPGTVENMDKRHTDTSAAAVSVLPLFIEYFQGSLRPRHARVRAGLLLRTVGARVLRVQAMR